MSNGNSHEMVQVVLVACLLLGGYFYILHALLGRMDNRKNAPLLAVVLALIYAAVTGSIVLTFSKMESLGLLFMVLLMVFGLGTLVFIILYLVREHEYMRRGPLALFILYIVLLLAITLIGRLHARENSTDILLVPFSFVGTALAGSFEDLHHVLLNLVLFIPMGFLLPMIDPEKLASSRVVFPVGLLFSTLIESVQFLGGLGQCDINDILANTAGALLGFAFYRLFGERLLESGD